MTVNGNIWSSLKGALEGLALEDRHNGKLGKKCARCHDPKARSWRLSDFDHETKTRFSLTMKHAGIKCIECHKIKGEYGGLSGNCATCHMKN